jgi:alanyl-tRNA synthetase
MTEKLFEQDAMLQECDATVVSCTPKDDKFLVVLDRTVIFPEGGGQLSDQGKIDDAKVSYAADKAGEVIHYADKAFTPGQKVHVTLDWLVRMDRMQQHTGEHILSYAFWKSCGANNIGFHMNEEMVTIDLDKEVTQDEVNKAEYLANMEIWQNKKIICSYMDDSEVAKLTMRKKNEKIHGHIRIVHVTDGDVCTCCGTHFPETGGVGLIKVLRFEKHKGGTRVEFNCGARALKNMQVRNIALEDTSNMLSVKVEDVPAAVTRLKADLVELAAQSKEKTMELFKAKLPELMAKAPVNANGDKLLFVSEKLGAKEAKSLMQLLSAESKVVIGIVAAQESRISYQFALGKDAQGDCKAMCQKANGLFGGKGGGNGSFAQGGAAFTADWQDKAKKLQEDLLQ